MLPTCLTTGIRQPTTALTQTDGATVAGLDRHTMNNTRDNHRPTGELAALAQTNSRRSPRVHRLAPRHPTAVRVLPMVPPPQHTGRDHAQPDHRDRCQPRVIETTQPGATGSGSATEGLDQGSAEGGKGVLPTGSLPTTSPA